MAALKQPGIADPYWYEWSVGLIKVVDMIAGVDAIESVTFQEAGITGIDDVVVRYVDGRPPTCYQVKHKTAGSEGRQSLTFGDLVSCSKDKPPLIASLVGAWIEASKEWGIAPDVVLYSNRAAGIRRDKRTFNGAEYKQQPLELFIEKAKQECSSASDYAGVRFQDSSLQLQWQEFAEAANASNKDELLGFMRHFSIDLNKPGLDDAMELIADRLRDSVLAGDARLAEQAREKLLASLEEWTTAGIGRNVVNREKALRCIAKLNEKPLSQPIDVAVPKPAFESRMRFAAELGMRIQEGSETVYFVTGKPGIGKTRLMSMLCAQLNPAPFRFYAFKPLDAEDISFAPDRGQSSAYELWSSLLNQLRLEVPNGMESTSIPIVNELCTDDQLRSEVLRLASMLADTRGSSTILVIDGIDHAARAGNDVTFLDHLPSPGSLPAGVKLVLAGQPASLYPNYPAWLRRATSNVYTIEIGPLDSNDVADLLMYKTTLEASTIALASKAIAAKTAGNTLSAVYAVQAVARLENGSDILEEIRDMPISDNVVGYYEHVWAKVRTAVEEGHPSATDSSLVMACTMHLLDGYVSPELLNGAFPETFPQAYMAERALSCAAPLLRRTKDDAYCPLHNDFRLFVDGMASDPSAEPCLAYVTDRLATHLLETDASSIKSCYAVRLLARAGRERDCLELFDTSFVIDSLARGIPWDYLREQAETVYGCACSTGSIEAVSKSLLAAATLAQANEHFEYLQESRPFSRVDRVTYQDMLVAPIDAQHIYAYKQALDRAVWLAGDCALSEEATMLFDVWTAGLSPSQFAQAIWGTDYATFDHNEEQEFKQLCITWGAYAALADVEYPDLDRDFWVDGRADDALLSFRDSYVHQKVITSHNAETVMQSLQRSGMSHKGVHDLLRDGMTRNNEISGIGFQTFLSAIENRGGNPYGRIAKALLILSGETGAFPDRLDAELLSERKLSYYATDETLFQLVAECFLFGTSCQLSKCEDAILSARHHLAWIDATQREYAELMHCVDALTCLGFVISHGQTILPGTPEASVLSRCLTDNYHAGFDPLTMLFVQHAIFNSSFRNLWESALEEDDMEALALSGRFTSCKLPLLDYLAETGNLTLLSTAIDVAYGDGGSRILASSDALGMHEMLRRYAAIIDEELVKKCDKAVFANIASFTEHKDYSLSHAVDLYRIACEAGNATESDTRLLLTIDSIANETGDNRVSESTTASVIAWAVDGGPRRLGKVRSWIPALRYEYDDLALQASALLGTAASTEEIYACFALLYGTTTYYRETGLLQIRSFAKECCAKIDSIGFDPKAKIPILTAIEPFSGLQLESNQADSISTQPLIPNTSIGPSPSILSIEELEDIAFRKPQGKWEWDEVEAAYSELISRGCPREATTEKLVNSRLSEFGQGGWTHYSHSLMQIIETVAEHASDITFFKLLETRKENLHLYGFGSSVEDVRFAIAHRIKMRDPETAALLLRDELRSKRLWVTANGYLPLSLVQGDGIETASPNSVPELVADALFESMVEQDPHRCEDAVRGVCWGGLLSERMRNRFADVAKLGSAYQRQLAWKVIDFWLCNGAGNSSCLIETVAEAHAATQRLDEALLTALVIGMPQLSPRPKNPPEEPPAEGKPASLPHRAKDFFNAMRLLARDSCDDLRAEILHSNVEPRDCVDVIRRYGRREDIENPGHDADELFQEILLREQQAGRWWGPSLGEIASLVFDPADAWVMRQLPTMTENYRTSVMKLIEMLDGENEHDVEHLVREIAHIDLPPGEEAIAWNLYLPYGETDELRILHVPKLSVAGEEIDADGVDATFGCYGIMAGRADMFVVPKSLAGIPLFGEQIGTISMVDCDCEVLPCRTLHMLGLSPADNDPMTWVNEEGVTAMRFERLMCPANGGFHHDMYYRRPQLWRWIGNMGMLEEEASRAGLVLFEAEVLRKNTDAIRERMNKQRNIDIAPPFEEKVADCGDHLHHEIESPA